jgi:hypothetical protein
MNKTKVDFDTWLALVEADVCERIGVNLGDIDEYLERYEAGEFIDDVVDEVCAEYGEEEEEDEDEED